MILQSGCSSLRVMNFPPSYRAKSCGPLSRSSGVPLHSQFLGGANGRVVRPVLNWRSIPRLVGTRSKFRSDRPGPDTPQRGSPMSAQASGLGNDPT
jgi:hypothetical protein